MAEPLLTSKISSISELKNPMGVLAREEGELLDQLEDMELNAIADARKGQERISVELDELA